MEFYGPKRLSPSNSYFSFPALKIHVPSALIDEGLLLLRIHFTRDKAHGRTPRHNKYGT